MFSVQLSSFVVRNLYVHLPAEVRANHTHELFRPYKLTVGPMSMCKWRKFLNTLTKFQDQLSCNPSPEAILWLPCVQNDVLHVETCMEEERTLKSKANSISLKPETKDAISEKTPDESSDSEFGDNGQLPSGKCGDVL